VLPWSEHYVEWFLQRFARDGPRRRILAHRSQTMPESRTMRRPSYTPSSCPVTPQPDPVLLFIQQAQLSLVYASDAK